uniref:Anti-sigma factor family protein n=1 Tax=Desertifilum tharense IPPAS B-1220 TaxID=1781255 RepID=A0ACD5GTL5_9CYAN
MTPQFDSHQPSKQPSGSHSSARWNARNPNSSMGALDMLKRDRFELLSAYLDGEVTASERQQVENWLDTDPVPSKACTNGCYGCVKASK